VFLKTLNALCICLRYKHPRSVKRVIRSDKPITSVFPVKSKKKCYFGVEPRCCLFVTFGGKGLNGQTPGAMSVCEESVFTLLYRRVLCVGCQDDGGRRGHRFPPRGA
jgi:hypothetical protein